MDVGLLCALTDWLTAGVNAPLTLSDQEQLLSQTPSKEEIDNHSPENVVEQIDDVRRFVEEPGALVGLTGLADVQVKQMTHEGSKERSEEDNTPGDMIDESPVLGEMSTLPGVSNGQRVP